MFIKILNHKSYPQDKDTYTIIDNVKIIESYSPAPDKAESAKDLAKIFNYNLYDDYNLIGDVELFYKAYNDILEEEDTPTKDRPYLYNTIGYITHKCEDDGKVVAFDTLAYIMSDDGKTIEKALGGGFNGK